MFSVPIVLSGLYLTTVAKIHRLTAFASRGRLYRLFSGRVFAIIGWSLWAMITSFFWLLQFHTYSRLEWLVFFLVVPLFWGVFMVLRNLIANEYKPYLVTAVAFRWSRRVTPVLLVLLHLVVIHYFADLPRHDSLEAAIAARGNPDAEIVGSALAFELSRFIAYYDGAKDFALGHLGRVNSLWALMLFGLGGFTVFFNACAMLGCFLIPAVEYRRVFIPLSEAERPARLSRGRVAAISAGLTFFALFIYLPIFTSTESLLRHNSPTFIEARAKADLIVVQIDDHFYRPGITEELKDARLKTLARRDEALPELEYELDRAFDLLESNVDSFLDWYYSLTAEYLRIANLLRGDIEGYMTKKLVEKLQQGGPFDNFETTLHRAIELQESLRREYGETAVRIMESNRIEPSPGTSFRVVQQFSLGEVLNPPEQSDAIPLEARLGAGGAAGIVSAGVVAKVIGKVSGKGVFKLAVKSAGKLLGGKLVGVVGGAAGGAGIGGTIGSAVPGVGTVLGAAVGGVVGGAAAGMAMDKGLLMLEEVVNREKFKGEMVSAIHEARLELRASLRP
ncbi:hypothetical protein ACHHRT_01295 [Desulfurivibrio sp. D14AmB]|uniref:hypothetical protein n=1 Tax=Desulfurivibrio sp. D14AmB TaxID=3374370 RepID=UPI00376EAC6F